MAAFLPLSFFAISASVDLVALRASQRYRPALLALFMLFASLSFRYLDGIGLSTDQASVLGLFVLIWMLHTCFVLCLEKHPPCPSWRSAYKMMFNGRWLGTEKAAPGTAISLASNTGTEEVKKGKQESFQYTKLRHPQGKQKPRSAEFKKWNFIKQRLLSTVVIFTLDYLYTQLFHIYHPLEFSDFLPSKQIYFRHLQIVTKRETLIRTWMVFHFVWSAWAVFTGLHHALSIVFVGLDLDAPQDWPPLYGSLYQTYSMRRFWGKFWHRIVYRSNLGYSLLVARKILRTKPGSAADRLVVNFLIFFISGVVHALVTLRLGFSCGYWEDIAWFCLNFAAFILEEAVQRFVHRSRLLRGIFRTSRAGKVIGTFWVFLFFFWSLPKTQYPKIMCATL